ncbi:MAG: hypothetical protein SYR96_24300 [Actinomycetota bacterium]|nr:hypothetical protein [Actinomycetota bacterium]
MLSYDDAVRAFSGDAAKAQNLVGILAGIFDGYAPRASAGREASTRTIMA